MQVIMHKLCRSKSSNLKLIDLHYKSDKNHSDSKLCQKVMIVIKSSSKYWEKFCLGKIALY